MESRRPDSRGPSHWALLRLFALKLVRAVHWALFVPIALLWGLLLAIVAVVLEVAWLGFVFGSVVGVVVLLVFMPAGFFLPLFLLYLWFPVLFLAPSGSGHIDEITSWRKRGTSGPASANL